MTTRSTMSIPEAAEGLGIPGRANLNGIHARFRELAKEWPPDVSRVRSGPFP